MLRLLIFFPLILFSQEVFLLPDEAHALRQSYNADIKNASKEIFVYTSDLDEPILIQRLKKAASTGIPVILISQEPLQSANKASYLSLFKNISIYTLHSHSDQPIQGSLICIDDKKFYLISLALRQKELSEVYAFATFKEGECAYLFKILLQRSTAY